MRARRGEHLQTGQEPARKRGLTPRQAALAEELRAALRNVDHAEIDRFFEEIDSIVDQDPTPRFWNDT